VTLFFHALGDTAGANKAPTALLLNARSKSTEAVGTAAIDRFAAAMQEGKQGDYLFFQHIKMALSRERRGGAMPAGVMVEGAGGGTRLPIVEVMGAILAAVRAEALAFLRKGGVSDTERVQWVVTVPAIWDDEAKDVYRKVRTAAFARVGACVRENCGRGTRAAATWHHCATC